MTLEELREAKAQAAQRLLRAIPKGPDLIVAARAYANICRKLDNAVSLERTSAQGKQVPVTRPRAARWRRPTPPRRTS
jgi:hypothetical protein